MLMALFQKLYLATIRCAWHCVSMGNFPEEVIQIFRKYDLFKVWELANEPYLDDSLEVAKYPAYHKIFKFGRTYFSHMVVTCNRNPMTKSMIDLIGILIEILSVWMESAWEEKNACTPYLRYISNRFG